DVVGNILRIDVLDAAVGAYRTFHDDGTEYRDVAITLELGRVGGRTHEYHAVNHLVALHGPFVLDHHHHRVGFGTDDGPGHGAAVLGPIQSGRVGIEIRTIGLDRAERLKRLHGTVLTTIATSLGHARLI